MRYIIVNVFVSFLLLILAPICVHAGYVLLEPLPGLAGNVSLATYIRGVYRTVLALAAFLAVTKIVIGGVYITAAGGSEANQTKGKEMINMALWGLLLALATVLILESINPQLIQGSL